MEFTVRDWMNDLVVYIHPDKLVTDALALMRRRYISSLIVEQTEKYPEFGIVTSTDISDKIIAHERNPSTITVGELMTSPLLTINYNASVKECSMLMSEHQVHHIPVVNDDNKIVGMISARDFLVVAEAMGQKPGQRIT